MTDSEVQDAALLELVRDCAMVHWLPAELGNEGMQETELLPRIESDEDELRTCSMDGKFMSASPVDFSDIQGLVRFGSAPLLKPRFLLLEDS